ncbi:MAG: DUF1707 domain-containing protein [Gemmatimonadota bacterium]
MTTPGNSPSNVPLEHGRNSAIDALCDHFANDRLTVEEFERRLDAAHQARSKDELDALLADLPTAPNSVARRASSLESRGGAHEVADPDRVKDREIVVAVMGGNGRKGRWIPARHSVVMAVMGGAELDFRDAVMPPGVTEVQIYAFWGGVDILVPPDMHVESTGFAVMGGFDHAAEDAVEPSPGAPSLRITGIAVMGAVDISVRRPGETARDARRRRRLERREQRKLERGE